LSSCKLEPSNQNTQVSNINNKTLIEDIIKVPEDCIKQYEVKLEENLSYSGIDRRQIRITVKSGLDKSTVDNNIKLATIEFYNKYQPKGISIVMFEEGDNIESAYTVAMGEFAPFGEWNKISSSSQLGNYKIKIQYKDAYFRPKEESIEVGKEIILFNEKEWNTAKRDFVPGKFVGLSKSAREWTDEFIIIKIPNNTKGSILDIHKEKMNDGSLFIRYKITVNFEGKNYIGWISIDEIKN